MLTKDVSDETYTAQYKCRLCGETYNDIQTGETVARACMYSALYKMPFKYNGIPPAMNGIHVCGDGSIGVSDFVGFRIE